MLTTANLEWRGLLDELASVGRAVQRRGVATSLRMAAASVGRLAYLRESHVWYRLDIDTDLQRIPLPPGVALLRAGPADLAMLEELPTISRRLARRRLREGAELWMAHESGRPLFACWIFHRRVPAAAALRRWLDLPIGTVGLDDSVTAPSRRGRALAPAAWGAVAAALAARRVGSIVTKIEETNLTCRRAIEKVGFRAVASMQFYRIGGHARVALHLHEQSATGFLVGRPAP